MESSFGGFVYWTDTYRLKQSGTTVTGTLEIIGDYPTCCTASFTVAVNGYIEGEFLYLTEDAGSAECQGINCTRRISSDGGTYIYTLVENGNILRSGSADYIRQFMMNRNESGQPIIRNEVIQRQNIDFIRQ